MNASPIYLKDFENIKSINDTFGTDKIDKTDAIDTCKK